MGIGADKRYFDRDFKYEAIRLMDEGKRSVGISPRIWIFIRMYFISGGVSIGRTWSRPSPGKVI